MRLRRSTTYKTNAHQDVVILDHTDLARVLNELLLDDE